MTRTTSRTITVLCLVGAMLLVVPVAHAEDAAPRKAGAAKRTSAAPKAKDAPAPALEPTKSAPSASAPPLPRDPTAREIDRAVEDARRELEAVKAESAKEQEQLGGTVAQLTKETTDLREAQRAAEAKLRGLEKDLEDVDKQLGAKTEQRSKVEEGFGVVSGELNAQVAAFEERFAKSLAAAEEPELLSTVLGLKQGSREDLPHRVQKLLDAYVTVQQLARTASVFPARIQLPSRGGKLEKADTLRLGLLGGYFATADRSEAGLVLPDTEGNAGLKGESTGIAGAQKAQIVALIERPESGGLLPSDVTGGSGIAALQTQESWARWFELGGFAMWPLLAVAIAALLLILERSVVLTVKSAGIKRKTRKVLALVRSGRAEDAEELCQKMGGAVGAVLHAALVHRNRERSVMEDAVQEALLHQAPSFQSRLGFISLCAAVAPLLGLFGTVTGMISTFKMVTLFGTSDPRFLAGGISEALITTEAGLMIAIPSLLIRGMLGAMADNGLGKLESGALSLVIELVRQNESLVGIGEEAAA